MRSRDSRQTIVLFTEDDGREISCPVIFERDHAFQTHNRMILLGTQANQHEFFHFVGEGTVSWRIPELEGTFRKTSGTCWFQTVGASYGSGLQRDTPQTIGEARVLSTQQAIKPFDEKPLRRRVSFLQRPSYWPVGGHAQKRSIEGMFAGPWRRVRGKNLRFRCTTEEVYRRNSSPTSETELIYIPGVEFEQHTPDLAAAAEFVEDSKAAWFACRILLMFYFRQHIEELFVTEKDATSQITTTNSIAILPEELKNLSPEERPAAGIRLENFLATGVSSILSRDLDASLLHAASFGYADSFRQTSAEGGITSIIESIERLLVLFEFKRKLSRNILDSKTQRRLSKALRSAVESVNLAENLQSLAKSAVTNPLTLPLEERILRMAASQKRWWSGIETEYLTNIECLIHVRNALTHGRIISDHSQIQVELLRARAIFEKLYLCLLQCGRARISGWSLMMLQTHYDNKKP